MNCKERRNLCRALEQAQSQTNAEGAGEEVQKEAGPSTSNMVETQVQQEQPEVPEESTNQNPTDQSREEEIDRLKLRVQIEYEERKEKSDVFSGLQEKARQSVQDEIQNQATANSFLRGQVESGKNQNQTDQLDKQKQELEREVSSLKQALNTEKNKVEALERERQQLTTEVSGPKQALGDYQTLQQEKVGLQSAVKDLRLNLSQEKEVTDVLRSRVNDLSQKIQEQEEISQALNQKVQTQTSTFRSAIERCQTAITCAVAQKDQLTTTVDSTKQELEALRLKHSDEMSAEQQQRSLLQERIEELSKALSATDQNNSDLEKQRLELQGTLRAKEDELQETLRAKEEEPQGTLRAKEEELQETLRAKEEELQGTLRAKEEELQETLKAKEEELHHHHQLDHHQSEEEEEEEEVVLLWLLSARRGIRGPGSNTDQDTIRPEDSVRADHVFHRSLDHPSCEGTALDTELHGGMELCSS
uniref:Uncharacterized protein n=1 Tax=Knipowitschia caucasica TaxID=637954 RepID=A0AAV2MBV6_KNICA